MEFWVTPVPTWSQTPRWAHPGLCWVYSAAPLADHWPLHPAVSAERDRQSLHQHTPYSSPHLLEPCVSGGCLYCDGVALGGAEGGARQKDSSLLLPPIVFWKPMYSSPKSAVIRTACRVIKHGDSSEGASCRDIYVDRYMSYNSLCLREYRKT